MPAWTENAFTQADVAVAISDWLYSSLPMPPYTQAVTQAATQKLYNFVYQQSAAGRLFTLPVAA